MRTVLRAFCAAMPCPASIDGLAGHQLGLGRMFFEPFAEPAVGGLLNEAAHSGVAQLCLGLTFELRCFQANAHHRGEALADVIALKVVVVGAQHLAVTGVVVHRGRQRRTETLGMHAALDRVDAVGEAVDAIGVEAGVPLEGDLHLVAVFGCREESNLVEQRFGRLIEMADEGRGCRLGSSTRGGLVRVAARR